MSSFLQQYAEVGARIRLSEIESERSQILEMFPSLAETNGNGNQSPAPGRTVTAVSVPTVVSTSTAMPVPSRKRTRLGHRMTPAQRASVSKRMKAYWRRRRAALKGDQATP